MKKLYNPIFMLLTCLYQTLQNTLDLSTYSNIDKVRQTKINLDLSIDFDLKVYYYQ